MMETPLHRWMDGEPGLEELAITLRELAGRSGRLLSAERLGSGVYRIALMTAPGRLSVVAKCHTPPVAHRNRLVLERWLPAAGLEHVAPTLLGVAVERAGERVWHVYEDQGEMTLEDSPATRDEVAAAIDLIASVHAGFAGAPVLAECRRWATDYGATFYDECVRGAVSAVAAVAAAMSPTQAGAAKALLEKLEQLTEERELRAGAMAEFGEPVTLLHGDLWLDNVAVLPDPTPGERRRRGQSVRIFDWDHVGVGPAGYDLSTLILRFWPHEQPGILSLYRTAAAREGVTLAADEDLGILFATAEYARLANEARWTACAYTEHGYPWAADRLASINDWFELVPWRSAAGVS